MVCDFCLCQFKPCLVASGTQLIIIKNCHTNQVFVHYLIIFHAGTGEEIEYVSDEELSLCSDLGDQGHEDKWLKIAGIQLYRSHHNMIVAESGWLNGEIINVAQSLLKNQYKMKEFQNTTLGCNLSFDIMRNELIQILFNGNNHWVTISTVGLPQPAHCINVYDSLYETLTDFTRDQICALLCSGEHCITARLMKVHKQKNMSDCGLLAIAYATSICIGNDVCTIQYASSMTMGAHLVKCFQESKMSPFPSTV